MQLVAANGAAACERKINLPIFFFSSSSDNNTNLKVFFFFCFFCEFRFLETECNKTQTQCSFVVSQKSTDDCVICLQGSGRTTPARCRFLPLRSPRSRLVESPSKHVEGKTKAVNQHEVLTQC